MARLTVKYNFVLRCLGCAAGILDQVFLGKKNVGCKMLVKEVLDRVKPLYHIFGHIHEAYGQVKIDNTTFINASTCTLRYKPQNPPVVFDLPIKSKLTQS